MEIKKNFMAKELKVNSKIKVTNIKRINNSKGDLFKILSSKDKFFYFKIF